MAIELPLLPIHILFSCLLKPSPTSVHTCMREVLRKLFKPL